MQTMLNKAGPGARPGTKQKANGKRRTPSERLLKNETQRAELQRPARPWMLAALRLPSCSHPFSGHQSQQALPEPQSQSNKTNTKEKAELSRPSTAQTKSRTSALHAELQPPARPPMDAFFLCGPHQAQQAQQGLPVPIQPRHQAKQESKMNVCFLSSENKPKGKHLRSSEEKETHHHAKLQPPASPAMVATSPPASHSLPQAVRARALRLHSTHTSAAQQQRLLIVAWPASWQCKR